MTTIERINPPKPDTHCFDDDTKSDVWSYSRELVISTVLAHIDKLEAENERLRKDAERWRTLAAMEAKGAEQNTLAHYISHPMMLDHIASFEQLQIAHAAMKGTP